MVEILKERLLGVVAKEGRSWAGTHLGNGGAVHIHEKCVSQD